MSKLWDRDEVRITLSRCGSDVDKFGATAREIIDDLIGAATGARDRADRLEQEITTLRERLAGIPSVVAYRLPDWLGGWEVTAIEPHETAPAFAWVSPRHGPNGDGFTRLAVLRADLVEMGSAGAKAMSILLGQADVYPHSGGQFEWDSAAPVALATAAGMHCSRLDGSPLIYNRVDSYLPDLLICRPEHAAAVIAASA